MDGAADDGDRHGVNITAIYIPLLGSSSCLNYFFFFGYSGHRRPAQY